MQRRRRLLIICHLAALSATGAWAAPAKSAGKVDFDRDVRPILSDNCFTCHGPDDKHRMAKLRLDTKEGLFSSRGRYQIITPGDSSRSRLYQKITAEPKAARMPPPVSGRALTEEQIQTIRRWIDEGANWEMHWSFVAPKRRAPPEVQEKSWPRNAIDNFILARLEREGLRPSPEADKTTLLRRVALDLTGLPPTPEEVDSFLADKSPDAYEKRVDRLLNSPHYGERMAMQWLDLARYADTHGYHIDSHRDMWHWRDWVIDAFNRNMPYDEFTIEQIGGDLLPHPTRQQLVATGFNRNHMINFEGGAIPEEYQNEYVVDRVETTSIVWLGLTMGCARCHDHKYDPIRQKEFYQFYAFFNTIPEKGLDGRRGNAEPVLQLSTAEQERKLEDLTREIAAKEEAMAEQEVATLQAKWEKTGLDTLPLPPHEGLMANYELDGHFADTSGFYHHARKVRGEVTYAPGPVGRSGVFSGETHFELANVGAFDTNDSFSFDLWIKPSGKTEMAVFQKTDELPSRRGYELLFDEMHPLPDLKRGNHLIVRLMHQWPDNAIQVETKDLVEQTWHHVAVNYDGSGKAAGIKLYVDGKPEPLDVVRDSLSGSIQTSNALEIGSKRTTNPYKGQIDDFRIYNRQLTAAEVEQLAIHEPIRAILADVGGKRSKEQKARLREYFLTRDAAEHFRTLYAELTKFRKQKEDLEKAIPTTMVMQEMEEPRETYVLGRGDYRNRGEKVSPNVPSALPPLPKDAPRNRLTLAKWLVDPSNPLAARVAVNRYWQMYFGTGLVVTAEDFGSQGDPPSHPELLDWLATEFIRLSWDIKAMQRLIVTSATYRQSSRVTPELLEKDPQNRLLARGPRFRLPAEVVRDNALAISGLLNDQVGGPSVFPYQPKGLWKETAYGDVYSAQVYRPSTGKDLYRRSMYTFWKRTVPPPSLATFDAPDREKCTARRARTNTPLQALVLLNDPTYVEAARALAQRMIHDAGRDPSKRINFGFHAATARFPTSKERQVLRDLAERELATYRRDPDAARKLLAEGEAKPDGKLDTSELAAWTAVASVILNLDETITKE